MTSWVPNVLNVRSESQIQSLAGNFGPQILLRDCHFGQFQGIEPMDLVRPWHKWKYASIEALVNTFWQALSTHDDVIKRTHFPRYLPFLWGIHRSSHKGLWRGALTFSMICTWINGWVNNREAGDLIRHRAHYDVTVMNSVHILASGEGVKCT